MGTYLIEFFTHVVLAYLAVDVYSMGLYGIALVTSFDYLIRYIVLQAFIQKSKFQ